MNQRSQLIAALGVLVVLAAGAVAYDRSLQKEDKGKREQSLHDQRMISPFTLSEQLSDGGYPFLAYESLRVTFGSDTTRLERRGTISGWWLSEPEVLPANDTAVTGLVAALENAQLVAALDPDPDAATLAKYGLDKPRFLIEAVATLANSEKRTVRLKGGAVNSFDNSVYVQRNDDPAVFVAPELVNSLLSQSTASLRKPRLLNVPELDVQRVKVKSPTHQYVLERLDVQEWDLTSPTEERADYELVTRMIQTVTSEKARGYRVDSPENRRLLGLDAPQVDVTFTMKNNAEVRLRMKSATTDAGVSWYVLFESEDYTAIGEFAPAVAIYDRDPAELRDRRPMYFDAASISSIVLRDVKGTVTRVDRVGGSWYFAGPGKNKASNDQVSRNLTRLFELHAFRFEGAEPADWKRYGVTERSASIDLFEADGGVAGHLAVGSRLPDNPELYFGQGERNQAMVFTRSVLATLPFTKLDLTSTDGGR